MHPHVHCSIIYNSQDLEAVQMPNSIQMDKKISGTNIQWNITPAIKNNEILLLNIIYRNKSEKDKYDMVPLIYEI